METNRLFQRLFLGLFFVGLSFSMSFAQDFKRYLVFLKDKNNTAFNINQPEKFLSTKAIQRRKNQNIKITPRDLPVNQKYVETIRKQGAKIWYTSKWMNAVMVETDEISLDKIKKLSFVNPQVMLLIPRKYTPPKNAPRDPVLTKESKTYQALEIKTPQDYGNFYNQAQMIGADQMHQQGYRGQGMTIAVFDSGFENADKVPFFKHIFDNQQLKGTYNFVDNTSDVYSTGSHGLQVLSTIAGYLKGKIIGTAPEANFYLFRTEDANTEYRVEEANWLFAAEKADSLGVDVINSSLGYTDFNDSTMDFTYEMLDGNTTLITRAADFAAATGMLVVNSAGNEGSGPWKYIGAPADADSIMAVGAVDKEGTYVSFSSKGPNAKNKIKPSISAQGLGSAVGRPEGGIGSNSGTSFSSPIMAGFAAGFWQANPSLSNMEVIEILQASASQANEPDNLLGYGIPNFTKADEIAKARLKGKPKTNSGTNSIKKD